jgi:3-methylcrotonyl-CoA carboxylase alpha subunit
VGAFYFMEMNTRLQVEHPVTEAITGQDLVEWQLRVASGEPLPLRQDQLRITGHAIEARICAETPDQQFLPATGQLATLRWPAHVAFSRNADHFAEHPAAPVRVDAGVRQGDAISPHYDSMVAKLIVHGDSREQALARLDSALAQTHIVGLSTNVQFLRHVLASESFSKAQLDTGLIAREQAVLFNQERLGLWRTAAAAVAHTLLGERSAAGADPFDRRDHWQSHAATQRRFEFVHREQTVSATLFVGHDGAMELAVAGQREPLRFASTDQGVELHHGAERQVFQVYAWGEERHVFAAQGASRITVVDLLAHAGEVHSEGGRLTAPMPGKVVSMAVKVGDKVSKGQPLAVMEAMKMEHTIAAPSDGVVLELLYAPGDQVAEGSELLKLTLS